MKKPPTRPTPPRSRKSTYWLVALLALGLWVSIDLVTLRPHSIRQFDPKRVAQLETDMWRSYYDKRPVLLFWQLASGLREQFHASFWRSFGLAFQATRAAFTFKQGQSRVDYGQTLPGLISYYEAIQELTTERFDVQKVAYLELEWWIVHRQRERYSYTDLADALVQTSAALYTQPRAAFVTYGRLRSEAMRLCDEAGRRPGGATETDWQQISQKLGSAWSALYKAVQPAV